MERNLDRDIGAGVDRRRTYQENIEGVHSFAGAWDARANRMVQIFSSSGLPTIKGTHNVAIGHNQVSVEWRIKEQRDAIDVVLLSQPVVFVLCCLTLNENDAIITTTHTTQKVIFKRTRRLGLLKIQIGMFLCVSTSCCG